MNKFIYKRIKAYKKICRLANVPQILIDYPELILQRKPNEKDLNWAKKVIKKYENNRSNKRKNNSD